MYHVSVRVDLDREDTVLERNPNPSALSYIKDPTESA